MKMEQKGNIYRKWMMSTLWSFFVLLLILVILNDQKPSFLATTISNLQQTPKLGQSCNNILTTNSSTTSSGANDHFTTTKKCNIFEGRWVYDPEQTSSYNATRCGEIISQSYQCQPNGRPDSDYEKWRWQPTDCDIPLFNATDMLERLRNKRLVIVGDSLSANHWQSLVCLLYSSISDPSRAERRGDYFFQAKDYNFTMGLHLTPFLVELNRTHESGRKVLVLDKISGSSEKWRGADIMVFNSWHWWSHPDKMKAWDVFEYKGKLIENMPRELAYERGMKTWARWIEMNVDPKKTKVIFRSNSEVHYSSHWCYNNTQPIVDIETYESRLPKPLAEVMERLIIGMDKFQVKYLNITKLTQYRSDAHQSIYTSLQWKEDPKVPADCSHWCLPGVPDTWNRLLYASLFFDSSGDL